MNQAINQRVDGLLSIRGFLDAVVEHERDVYTTGTRIVRQHGLTEGQMGFYDWDRMKPEEVTDLYLRKVVAGESIIVARIEGKEGAVTLPHNHESEEGVIVLSGAWRFQLPNREERLST